MDPKDIESLAKVLREQGDKLLTSEFKFTLTGEILRSLNDSFSLIIDDNESVAPQTFQVTKPNNSKSNVFRELMFIYDFIQKTLILKLTKFLDDDEDDNCVIDISKFRHLQAIEIQRIKLSRIVGLQQLRSQLQEITVERSLTNVKDLIVECAGDKSNGFIWNSLKHANFSYNGLEKVDSSFEFTPYLQHLNLSHNKIFQISALVWCPNLKFLNLSFNQLTTIPKLNVESYRRLQTLIISDNLIEDVSGLVRLDALLDLDISGNCLLDHSLLLPLCTLNALKYLNLSGNPLAYHPKHRVATCRYLSRNAKTVQFQLDCRPLSQNEKSLTGSYENYYPVFGHRMNVSVSSSRATPQTPSTATPDNNSLSSVNSSILHEPATVSSQKRMKPRCVEIEESGGNQKQSDNKSPTGKKLLKEGSKEHLTTKREIEQLREQFGSEWLVNQAPESRKKLVFQDLLSTSPAFEKNDPLEVSTPQDETLVENEATLYNTMSADDSTGNSIYASAMDDTFEAEDEEIVVSEPEENEVQFIVVNDLTQEDLFLTVSDVNIKEKDAMNGRTLAKWGLITLESVERPKTEILRMTFDTIRKDKRERQYRMEAKCCQDLEKILRDFLSSRPLSAMNQTVYKCPKCNSQFSREIDERKKRDFEIKCPCGNKYVIEIQKTNKCDTEPRTSFFAGNLFMPNATKSSTSTMSKTASSISIEKKSDSKSDDSVGGYPKTSHSFSSIESAFDSNQSVAGSSVEVLSECSSQISFSQTSQSSIEVIDRKPSEERRISHIPSLDTIEDDSLRTDHDETLTEMKKSAELKPKVVLTIGNVNLTESSSSGSVCESVVTAYEGKREKTPSEEPKLDGIFKTSSLLLSKTPKPKKDAEPLNYSSSPIQYNYEDLTVVDHRVKLFLFQNILEENDEKLIWLVKSLVIEDDATLSSNPSFSLVIMSTKKIYVLKIVGEETEDIATWLKKSIICSIDRLEAIREIPGKTGFTFVLTAKTNVHLLLQDQNLTDRLRKHITTSNQSLEIQESLPAQTKEKLLTLSDQIEFKTIAIFRSCATSLTSATESENSQELPKVSVDYGCLIVTAEGLHMTTNFHWLCDNVGDKVFANRKTLSQPMSNLVELENVTKTSFTLSFMDELENTIEKWRFVFESYPRIARTLEIVDGIWREIFCVPLISDDQVLG